MRTIILVCAFCFVPAIPLAQEAGDEEAGLEIDPDPVARAAWEPAGEAAAAEQDAAGAESDAFARIHDADATLPELERARRMVGFDVMDGVR